MPWCLVQKVKVEAEEEPSAEPDSSTTVPSSAAPSTTGDLVQEEQEQEEQQEEVGQKRKLSEHKDRYNKFNYRMRKNPEIKSHYQKLLKSKNQGQVEAFIDDISKMKGKIPEDYIKNLRSWEESTANLEEQGWIPWRKAADEHGEDCLLEMITSGTTLTKQNPSLPAETKIPFPRNQVVLIISEKVVKKKETSEKQELHEFKEVTPESHEDFLKEKALKAAAAKALGASAPKSCAPTSSSSTTSDLPFVQAKDIIDKETKAAMSCVRKAHAAADRAQREWQAVIQSSSNHENTKGCKFEKDLSALVKEVGLTDAELQKIEQKYLQEGKLQPGDIAEAATKAQQLKDTITDGNKKMVAIKSWMKA